MCLQIKEKQKKQQPQSCQQDPIMGIPSGDTAGLVPDHQNKEVSIAVKQVTVFFWWRILPSCSKEKKQYLRSA